MEQQLQSGIRSFAVLKFCCPADVMNSSNIKYNYNYYTYVMVPFVESHYYSICQMCCWTVFLFIHQPSILLCPSCHTTSRGRPLKFRERS